MANDLNQINIIGRLGADPETRYMPSGDAVTNMRVAVGWKSKDKEGTEWFTVNAFGKLAEICSQYLQKGAQVFISGSMRTRKWTDKAGVERFSSELVADRMQMIGGKHQDGSERGRNADQHDDQSDDIPF